MVVIVYTKQADPYSARACTLLRMKGVAFVERKLPEHADEMLKATGSRAAPQIIVHGRPIGGFDQLGSLDLKGELDRLLSNRQSQSLSTQPK